MVYSILVSLTYYEKILYTFKKMFSHSFISQIVNERTKNVTGKTMLVDYVRDVANLKGTKVMCREGGCGACLVNAKVIDPKTGSEITKSVNSVTLKTDAIQMKQMNC